MRKGVARCHLIDHDLDGGLLLEFFTHAGVGTVVSRGALLFFPPFPPVLRSSPMLMDMRLFFPPWAMPRRSVA